MPQTATPTFSPAAGTYNTAQSVTLNDTTSGAAIYYTTNGSTPTTSSTLYAGPISVTQTTTIKAIAAAAGFTNSAIATAAYTLRVATPTFGPAAGTYSTVESVTLSDTTSGAAIYYTTNGSTPTTSSTPYTAPISVTLTTTVKAIAALTGWSNSVVATAAYTLQAATPTFSPVTGTYTGAQLITISDVSPGVAIYYTTNGRTPTTSSTPYIGPISVSATTTIKAIAARTGWTQSGVASATYTIH